MKLFITHHTQFAKRFYLKSLGNAAMLAGILLFSSGAYAQKSGKAAKAAAKVKYAELVNAEIGNKGKGHDVSEQYLEAGYTFPGAMYPFGMAQFTPTFFAPNKGFVINQYSGAGCEHMGNCPTLALPGTLQKSPDDMLQAGTIIKTQKAVAGYYKALIENSGITGEFTVTQRTGMAKFSFPASESKGTVIVGTGINAGVIKKANVKVTGKRSFEGYADGGSFCGYDTPYMVYFSGEFSADAFETGVWEKAALKKAAEASGQNSGTYFTFDVSGGKTVSYKIGISYVSLENAKENLKVENAGWDFEKTKNKAMQAWDAQLSKVKVEGADKSHITEFYTGLYHTFTHPGVFNDVNGQYMGADFKVHKAEGFNYYTAFSNWDTYRTQIQLVAMLAPKEAGDMVKSLIAFAEQSGGGWPRWVLANIETGIMQGDPTSVLVANAYAFGAKDFDLKKALEIMRRGAEVPGTKSQKEETRPFVAQYLEKGYAPASMSLEYNSADFAIAQFAKQALKDNAVYAKYLAESQKWKNLYNPKTKWLQSRNADGSWKPLTDDMREASYKNYFWMVPHNLATLIDTIGGKQFAEERLDEFFTKLNADYNDEWFAAGNEPDFQVPWAYNWTNAPYKTQSLVKRIIAEQYANRASGLPGNDDLGAMGAFYVFANVGLFPVVPAVGGFSITSPSFSKIEIALQGGKTLTILGGNEGEAKPYINSLEWNGKKYDNTWIPLSELAKGGTLKFDLSATPNKAWGKAVTPPSFDSK
jgi:predicted alpha-1,2-mannosidase